MEFLWGEALILNTNKEKSPFLRGEPIFFKGRLIFYGSLQGKVTILKFVGPTK